MAEERKRPKPAVRQHTPKGGRVGPLSKNVFYL